MGLVVTIANRKGGVGKTTLAIALAETFVFEHKKSAVIVDLDPQSSASEILLSEREYADRLEQQNTLSGFFRSSLSDHKLNISSVLSHAKHSLSGRGTVDLAVAVNSPELWDLEYEVLRSNQEVEYGTLSYCSGALVRLGYGQNEGIFLGTSGKSHNTAVAICHL